MKNNQVKKFLRALLQCIVIAIDIQLPHIYYSFGLLTSMFCLYYDDYKQGRNHSLIEYIRDFIILPIIIKTILIILFL